MQSFKAKIWIEAGKVADVSIWTDSFAADSGLSAAEWLRKQTSATFRCADDCKLLIAGVMRGDECVSHTILGGE